MLFFTSFNMKRPISSDNSAPSRLPMVTSILYGTDNHPWIKKDSSVDVTNKTRKLFLFSTLIDKSP